MEKFQPELDDYKCVSDDFKPGMQYPIKPATITNKTRNSYDVIIIGGGVAGLEAAHQLQAKNVDVAILEGRDRIGGRIYTNNETGIPLDLGGSWIHGLNKNTRGFENPIYKIALKNNIATIETHETTTLFDSSSHQINDRSYDIFHKYEKFAEQYGNVLTDKQRQEINTQQTTENFYESTNENDVKNPAMYTYTMQWYFDMDQAENNTLASFANSDLSTLYEDDEREVIFPYGYTQIANCLAGGLTILHANVTTVDYRNEIADATHSVEVFTEQRDAPFKANYVISTLPLSVLQNATNTKNVKFDPKFDQAKIDAINHLKMATMDKTYLIFNYTNAPFWSDTTWINRVSDDNQTYNTAKRWQFFLNLYKIEQKPALLAFNVGKTAKNLEFENVTKIKKEIAETLGEMYHRNITDSEFIVFPPVTRWSSDPLAGGSYSYIPVNGSADDFDTIAMPIGNKLFFAGEATNKYYAGTVHGAYISGYRTAEEIIKVKSEQDLDSPRKQMEHGIKSWDVICKKGEIPIGMTSNDDVKCTKKYE